MSAEYFNDESDEVRLTARIQVVALSDAWQKGARGWAPAKRKLFANDPLNLLAVDGRRTPARATATPPPRCPRTSASAAATDGTTLIVTAP
jgi:hypothetical protein